MNKVRLGVWKNLSGMCIGMGGGWCHDAWYRRRCMLLNSDRGTLRLYDVNLSR
jgi:hypothetical protein